MNGIGIYYCVCTLYEIFNVIPTEAVRLIIPVRCPLSPVDRNLGDRQFSDSGQNGVEGEGRFFLLSLKRRLFKQYQNCDLVSL